MSIGSYLLGCILLIAAVGAIGYASFTVRARVLPRWSNGPARLAEIIIGLSTVVVVAEILGTFGWFQIGIAHV